MRLHILIPILTVTLLLPIPLAHAHVLESDQTVGAVVHIDPDDAPFAKRSAHIFFEFKDTANHFNLANCACQLTVEQNEQRLATVPLSTIDSLKATASYEFPAKGSYQLELTGRSKEGVAEDDEFTPFTLSYPVQVDREDAAEQNPTTVQKPNQLSGFVAGHFIHFLLTVGAFIVFFILIEVDKRKAMTNSSKK